MLTIDSSDIDVNDELLAYALSLISSGYYAESQLPEMLRDWIEGDNDDPAEHARIAEVIERAIALQLKAQENYPEVTDYDRLRQAFDQLEATGFLVRENYTCCQSCGWSEVNEELADAVKQGRPFKGVVFFHEQDTDGAVEGGGLYLAYGGENGSEAAGQQITQALQAAGLGVTWDGTEKTRIMVPMAWQRRFVRGT